VNDRKWQGGEWERWKMEGSRRRSERSIGDEEERRKKRVER